MNDEANVPTIGKYRIVGRIGSGGFGTVFEAWDPVIKRAVAIKVCDARKEVRARFLQEAELAGRLHHPNITAVYECGVEGETPFIVQEFLGGEDLSALIGRREPLELADRIKILAGVAVGLDYAHRSGVVHRDVKPANIRVLDNGVIKIMDFGIAKAMDAPSVVTGTGITVGSSAYMAPEQVCGDAIGPRTDIFSFGVLAYELLSYRKAFDSENLFRTLEMIVKEEAEPLAFVAPWLPQDLSDLVSRAMSKRPADRFASMKDVLTALVAVDPTVGSGTQAAAARASPAPSGVEKYAILDTAPEPEFDELARLAGRICEAPMALISLLDRDRLWIKSAIGVQLRQMPLEGAPCARTALGREVLVIEDTAADAACAASPLVRQEPRVRFYAGAPLVAPDGGTVGALCVLDTRPRTLSADGREALRVLARQVVAQMELRRRPRESESSGERLLLEVTGLSDTPVPRRAPEDTNG